MSAKRKLLEFGCLCLDLFRLSFSNFFTEVDLTTAKSKYQDLKAKHKENFFLFPKYIEVNNIIS